MNGKGDKAIISWGSHKYIAQEVASHLGLAHIHFNHLWPLPTGLDKLLGTYKQLISIENNETHQLARLLRQETGLEIQIQLGEDLGRPLNPTELTTQIKNYNSKPVEP